MIRSWRARLLTLLGASVAGTAHAQTPNPIDSVRLQGYVQVQAEFGDATDTRFPSADRMFVRRARLYALGSIARDWEVRLMLDGAPGLTPRRDVPASLVEAYVRWKRYPAAVVQVGQYKTPFTYEESHSASQLLTVERTLAVDRLKPSRQVGILVSGAAQADRLRYAGGVFNGTGTSTNANDDDRFLYVGRLVLRPASGSHRISPWTWDVGASGLMAHDSAVPLSPDFEFDSDGSIAGRNDLFSGSRSSYALDTQFKSRRVEIWAEYLAARFAPDNAQPVSEFRPRGWYTLAAVSPVPDRLQLVGRYEEFDQRRANGPGAIRSTFVGANYYLSRTHDLKLQGGHMMSRHVATDDTVHRLLLRAQLMFSVL